MDTIRFANGASYHTTFVVTNPAESRARVALADISFAEAAAIFSNPEMTQEMRFGNLLMVGYTNLTDLCVRPYGIQAVLKGGHDEQITD
jgi:hypothetical protein